jgi:hypothetical protein
VAGRDAATPAARLLVEATTKGARPYRPTGAAFERGAYTLPLADAPTTIDLTPN